MAAWPPPRKRSLIPGAEEKEKEKRGEREGRGREGEAMNECGMICVVSLSLSPLALILVTCHNADGRGSTVGYKCRNCIHFNRFSQVSENFSIGWE